MRIASFCVAPAAFLAALITASCRGESREEAPPPRHGGQGGSEAPRSGASGSGGEGAPCGPGGVERCEEPLFCLYAPEARCGEEGIPGRCERRPEVCTREYRPVCGCDGRTHGNRCSAHAEGVSVRHDGPCGEPEARRPCVRAGCSGELCVEEGTEVASICVFRPEHACYRDAICQRQPDGQCGWTRTPTLLECLRDPPPPE